MSVPSSRAHAALRATCVVYVCLGFGTSAWLSRLPDVRDDLGLTPATIGTMLLIASLGSLLTLPTSGPIVTKIGARASGRIGVAIWALGIVCAGIGALNVSIPLATLGLVLLAAGNGLWGATMNIEAGLVQAAVRRTVVPIIQAMYAVGMLGGALLGALASQMGLPLGAHLFGLAALELLACGTAVGFYLTKEEVAALAPAQDKGDGGEASSNKAKGLTRVAWREKQTVLIALMVMSAGLMEGAANDWLNLSMVDGYGYSTAAASAAFAFFLLMMTIVRFASPRLEARLGSPMLLRITFTGAVVGLLLVAFAPHHLFAVAGIALWGIGSALGFPLGISALSVDPVMTPARVSVLSTVNYGAALIGPPLLGLIADHIGYHRALAFVALPVLLAIVLAGQVPDRRGTKRTDLAFGD
ncbi:MFS transporter [Pauljensenia sp. UMB0018B]|uniref:MFS transporter n=1 Tax=Schaalia odontolytica TaxID=1660 RepID=A0A2I1I207_9ACTO|nr:MFS transporter [Schaalia odontolytica]MDK7339785.1 MFS transporter [Pauljensenia sp. UMB0018B]PKY65162.1 MFS transporter [Schaalia odontolytica]